MIHGIYLSVSLLFKNKIHGKYFPMVRAARKAGARAQATKKEIREGEGEKTREGEEKKGEELVPSQLLKKLNRAFPSGALFTLGMVRQRYANPRRPNSAAVKRALDARNSISCNDDDDELYAYRSS